MNASYRPAVPRKWLLGPVIGTAIVAAVFTLVASVVPGYRPVHGEGGIQLFSIFLFVLMIAGVIELFALAISIAALVHAPELRTAANLAAVAFGAGPFLALALWLL